MVPAGAAAMPAGGRFPAAGAASALER